MSGTFDVDWQPNAVLRVRRTGVLSPEDGEAYGAAVTKAIDAAPAVWAMLVDLREAGPSDDELSRHVAGIMQHAAKRHVRQIVVVTPTAVDGLQQRRMTTIPGAVDPSLIAFYTDFDQALAALQQHLGD